MISKYELNVGELNYRLWDFMIFNFSDPVSLTFSCICRMNREGCIANFKSSFARTFKYEPGFSSDGIGIRGGPEGLAESPGSVLMMGGRDPTNRNPPCRQGVKDCGCVERNDWRKRTARSCSIDRNPLGAGRGEDEKQTNEGQEN